MAPMEVVSTICPSRSQGGGFYIYGSSAVVSFTNCDIYDNEIDVYVSLCPAEFHGPHGSSFPELTPCPCCDSQCYTCGVSCSPTPHSIAPMEEVSRKCPLTLAGWRRVRPLRNVDLHQLPDLW